MFIPFYVSSKEDSTADYSVLFPPMQEHTEFIVNAAYPVVLDWLSKASIGLSTMVDEHFGINIVEFMARFPFPHYTLDADSEQAAGVIPVAHASGGPLKDIIVPFNGKSTGMLIDFRFSRSH